LEHCSQCIVWKRNDAVIVDSCHVGCSDHRIDDGFFRGFDRRSKDRIEGVVGQYFEVHHMLRGRRTRIGRRKDYENVARFIARNAAIAAQPQGDAMGQAFELVRQQWCIGGCRSARTRRRKPDPIGILDPAAARP
jgi:hypothetical protein